MQEQNRQLHHKPIIFTPDMDNPYNPNISDIQQYTETDPYVDKLAEPKFKIEINTPDCYDESDPETYRMLNHIKELKHIRLKYHWKSFYYRPIDQQSLEQHNRNSKRFDKQAHDTISTCSTASIATNQIHSQKHLLNGQYFYNNLVINGKARKSVTNTKRNILLKSHNPFEQRKRENHIKKKKQKYIKHRITCFKDLDSFDEKLTFLFGKQPSIARQQTLHA